MNWTRDHQWQLDNMSEPEDEGPTCEDCGEAMQRDFFGEWVCQACEQKKEDERNENRQ